MVEIFVKPEDVWGYCQSGSVFTLVLARNKDFGVEIALIRTGSKSYEVDVELDDETIEEFQIGNDPEWCEAQVEDMYDYYLTSDPTTLYEAREPKEEPVEELSAEEMMKEIEDRNWEILSAAEDLLTVLAPGIEEYNDVDEISGEIADMVCDYLRNVYEVSVYRPMIVKSGDEYKYVEYPYDKD